MVIGKSNCETCKKEFKWRRCNNYLKTPKYCSVDCRKYENQNYDQILNKLKYDFDKKVIRQEGCWDWKGFVENDGYARMPSSRTKFQRASRVSYLIHKGNIEKNMIVCHSCDNPVCCNPEHLFLGTPNDNSKDMVYKDRQAKGSRNGKSKLNEENVKEIKKLFNEKIPMKVIAEMFGVYISSIEKIKTGTSWKHVGDNI